MITFSKFHCKLTYWMSHQIILHNRQTITFPPLLLIKCRITTSVICKWFKVLIKFGQKLFVCYCFTFGMRLALIDKIIGRSIPITIIRRNTVRGRCARGMLFVIIVVLWLLQFVQRNSSELLSIFLPPPPPKKNSCLTLKSHKFWFNARMMMSNICMYRVLM